MLGRDGPGALPRAVVVARVSDPHSFDTDPDPAFWAEYRSGSGSRVFMTKFGKIAAEFFFFFFF